MNQPTVYVVHCIDTEGPMEETLEATFERIRGRFGLDLKPDRGLLDRLQREQEDLDGLEAQVADFVAPNRLAYLSRWQDIEDMVSDMAAPGFRARYPDGSGLPWIFSWFIIDVVGYKDNPRRKPEGFHAVWDIYSRLLADSPGDSLGWHFHTVPARGSAVQYNTCWTNNDWHEQVLARRVIERGWFPSMFRAGACIERNDVSHWLEQFIPFDFSCASSDPPATGPGDDEDWRTSPTEWRPFHPSWRDYRVPGSMRRHLLRCLPVGDCYLQLTPEEVDRAFAQAREHGGAVLAFSSHDRRDVRPEVEKVHGMLLEAAGKYPDVAWKHANAHDAARACLGIGDSQPPKLEISIDAGLVSITSDSDIFGPAPYLAVRENERFFRDNPTRESGRLWMYKLRNPGDTRAVGVAACNEAGQAGVAVKKMRPERE